MNNSLLISIPTTSYVSEQLKTINPESVRNARVMLKQSIARELKEQFLSQYNQLHSINTGSVDHREIGARSLRDVCLGYLCSLDDEDSRQLSARQLEHSKCMTDASSAIANKGSVCSSSS